MVRRSLNRIAFADGASLDRNINSHRTPRDAAAATDAARYAKLVNPGGELMHHPLAITRSRSSTHASAVDVGEVHREARVPFPPAFGVLASQVSSVFHRGAEAGGAHHGAVRARQATVRHVVPLRMLVVAVEEFLDSARVQAAAHVARGVIQDALSVLLVSVVGRLMRDLRQYFGAARRSHVHHKVVPPVLRQLCESEIEAGSRLRSGIHRSAEAVAASQPAIDRQNKQALAPRFVARINELTLEKDFVLNGDRMQFAGAHAEESIIWRGALFFRQDPHSLSVSRGLRQPLKRRIQELLPGVRADNVAE